jgi:hypothetical protein
MGYGGGGCGAWAEGSCNCEQPCDGKSFPDDAFPQYASSKDYAELVEITPPAKPMFQFSSLEELLTCDEVRKAILKSIEFANCRVDGYRRELVALQVKLDAANKRNRTDEPHPYQPETMINHWIDTVGDNDH